MAALGVHIVVVAFLGILIGILLTVGGEQRSALTTLMSMAAWGCGLKRYQITATTWAF